MHRPVQVRLPALTIPLEGVNVDVVERDGTLHLVIGPVVMSFVVPLTREGAEAVGHALTGGKLVIARSLPSDP
jgi:hypothetical protein